jgi:hypothetical protein
VARCPYIPQRWLSHQWALLTGSTVVDIRAIKDAVNAAKYVAKYAAKAPHHFDHTKRYRFSYGYLPDNGETPPELLPPISGWQYLHHTLPEIRPVLAELTLQEPRPPSTDIYHAQLRLPIVTQLDGLQMDSPARLHALTDLMRPLMHLTIQHYQPRLTPTPNSQENPRISNDMHPSYTSLNPEPRHHHANLVPNPA